MNEKMKQDQAVSALQKAAKSVRAPKLDESILENATKVAARPSLLERLGLNRKLAGFSLAGAAASVAVAAVVLGGAVNPQNTFTLEMGAPAAQGSDKGLWGSQADSKIGSSSYWPSPIQIEYVAGDALTGETGTGSIYEFVNNTTAKELSASIKRVLKIDGAFVTETYGVETPNGTEKVTYFNLNSGAINVYVSDTNGALTFYYSNGDAYITGDCVKEESSPETPDVSYCVENAPVKANLPSDNTAIAQALEVFKSLGFDTTAGDIKVNRSEDSMYASAPIKVDGKSTGLSWDISWGNSGEVSGVNGYAVDAVKVADVSTISAKDTVKRMSDYRWMASGSAELYNYLPSVSSRSTGESIGTGSTGESIGTEGKKQTMLIVKATEVMGIIYDANGKMWVVPCFAMYAENDNYPLVHVSVQDGVIKLPEPIIWPTDDIEPRVKTG
jgi:hypothetical protein